MDHNIPMPPSGDPQADLRDHEFISLREQVLGQMRDITISEELIARTLNRADQEHKRRVRNAIAGVAACLALVAISLSVFFRAEWFPGLADTNEKMTLQQRIAEDSQDLLDSEGAGLVPELFAAQLLPEPMVTGLDDGAGYDGIAGLSLPINIPAKTVMLAHVLSIRTAPELPEGYPESDGPVQALDIELPDACEDACGRPINVTVYVRGEVPQALSLGQDVLLCLSIDEQGTYWIDDPLREIIPIADGLTAPQTDEAYIPRGLSVEDALNNY